MMCAHCGKGFQSPWDQQRYCSAAHKQAAKVRRYAVTRERAPPPAPKSCIVCESQFTPAKSHQHQKYCCIECSRAVRYARKKPEGWSLNPNISRAASAYWAREKARKDRQERNLARLAEAFAKGGVSGRQSLEG